MRKEVCSHQDKAAAKPSQQPSGFQIFILRHFYPTITCKKVGIMDMCWWTVTLLTKDILDFVNLLEWDFSSKYPSWILCEFSNNPNLLSGLQWASFYLNWRRTCHLGPFQEQPSPEICYLWLSIWTHCPSNSTVRTVTVVNIHHLVSNSLDSFLFVVIRACHNFKRTFVRTPEDDSFGQKQFQAPTPMNYWTHPASQPAFRFPPKHLSHLWLDPCCLDTVHAVVIGPYPNQ